MTATNAGLPEVLLWAMSTLTRNHDGERTAARLETENKKRNFILPRAPIKADYYMFVKVLNRSGAHEWDFLSKEIDGSAVRSL